MQIPAIAIRTLKRLLLLCLPALALVNWNCSSEKNTVTSKAYHDLTAHYNGYYYALDEIKKIESTILKSHRDDYNKILSLFPSFDSTLAKTYEKEIEEAIKMASISITRHPNSKWVDDAYILIGKARLYSLDWGNAIQTFKYVNTKSKDPDAKHRAIINLIRTFTVHKEYLNAEAAIDFLKKEQMSNKNKKDFLLEKAYFHQTLGDYDNMVRSLAEAAPLVGKSDRRGRLYFIVGQVYQELGFEAEAFNFYRKCLATNPEYETDFYARLYMAQVAVISRSKDVSTARKSFRRLLKDSKNKEFKDKIYYEMGAFELKQKNVDQAITDFNLAIREGTNRNIDGEAYLQLGEIYYDTLRDYQLAQSYYDSTIGALPKDYENYAAIKARQEILSEFVTNLNTIQWQDSLLRLSVLDSTALLAMVDSSLTARKKLEELKNKGSKKKKKRNRVELQANDVNVFASGSTTDETGNWYFGNPSAVSLGQSEFRRTWGEIKLEDNWRRSARVVTVGRPDVPLATNEGPAQDEQGGTQQQVEVDPVKAEYAKLNAEIPRTEEAKAEAFSKIESAYFRLGDIYYFDLLEKVNALAYYNKLLDRFPQSEFAPEALYKIYLIHKEQQSPDAQRYADLLSKNYPNSTYAKILENPDYLMETSKTVEKQKAVYSEAYALYRQNQFVDSKKLVSEAMALGQTEFTPSLELLTILLLAKTDGITPYQNALKDFIATYPESELTAYASNLLNASEKYSSSGKRDNATLYAPDLNSKHYFIMAYDRKSKVGDVASRTFEEFNRSDFRNQKLNTSNLVLNETYTITMITDFANGAMAIDYYNKFRQKVPSLTQLRNQPFQIFVISQENFNVFYRTKTLTEYMTFFSLNYNVTNP